MMAIAHYNSLDRFPTWMWIRDDGYTLVLGAPGDSYVFYTPQFPIDRLLAYPLYVLAVLFVDALILFCMYAMARRRAQRAVKPVTEALDALSRGQSAEVTLGGNLAEIGNRLTDVSRIIERKDSARALWIRGVSHDIRTPLSLVVGQADVREQAGAIREQGMKIAALVTDLNTAAQLDYDAKPVQTERVAPSRIVRDACARRDVFRGQVASRLHGHGDAAAGSLGALAGALNKLRGAGDGAGAELAPPRETPEAG